MDHCSDSTLFSNLTDWLSTVSVSDLKEKVSPELQDALVALERLRRARCHQQRQAAEDFDADTPNTRANEERDMMMLNSLANEMIEKVLYFLDSHELSQTMLTCRRLERICRSHIRKRVEQLDGTERHLSHPLQIIRADEHVRGHASEGPGGFTRIPVLLLPHRVLVTGAGDPDFNGVYFCTGCNANGFMFSRTYCSFASIRFPSDRRQTHSDIELAPPAQYLRCIISKRFSNDTLLWYFSKEVPIFDTPGDDTTPSAYFVIFKYWAKLTTTGQASADLCRYPSQSSVLRRRSEDTWHTLPNSNGGEAPQVELLGVSAEDTQS